jgi:hypothetical protein
VSDVAWQFREAASRDPERFMHLLIEHWEQIPDPFREAPMAGAASFLEYRHGSVSDASGKWKPVAEPDSRVLASLLLDEIVRHPERWRHARETADVIEACANVVDAQEDAQRILAIAAELAEADDAALEDFERTDIVGMGINSIRGNAAEAVIILGTRWAADRRAFPSELRPCLLRFAADPHPAVRAVLLRRLPWLQHHDPTLGWDVFRQAITDASEHAWEVAEPCLYYAYQKDFSRVSEYLQWIDATGMGKARETWGRISMLACLSGHVSWSMLFERLVALGDADAWKGVLTVLANNGSHVQHRQTCFNGLAAAFQHAPDASMVADEMEALFREHEAVIPVPADLVCRRLAVIAGSTRQSGFHLHGFDEWLAALADSWPNVALDVAVCFADFIRSTGMQIYDHAPMGRLLTRLFREAEELEEADGGAMLGRVIGLQDELLTHGVSGLQEWLRDAERP